MKVLIALLSCLTAVAAGAAESVAVEHQASAETVAFVGRLLDIHKVPDPCASNSENPEVICLNFDESYEARYEVLDILHGMPQATTLTFAVYDHYGFPAFARFKTALLFVTQDSDGNYLQKYQGFAVQRTLDGGWARCGDFSNGELNVKADARVQFAPDVVFGDVSLLSDEAVREQFDPQAYRVIDGRVLCRKAVRIDDMFRAVRDGVLKARGVILTDPAAPVKDAEPATH